jgi:hypothetical protein
MAVEVVDYIGLPNCRRLTNGTVEIIVTADIGPRIIRYAFIGAENILGELPETAAEPERWKPWGGHRLWAAPEAKPRTYAPDNDPVEVAIEGDRSIRLTGRVDASGIEKEIMVELDPEGSGVTIHHRITNRNLWGIDLAPWGLTIMNGGGVAILPQEPYRPHGEYLLPARSLALWHYTDLSDPRWKIGARYIRLRTDAGLHNPQKIGLMNRQEWGAYLREGTLFIKRFLYLEGGIYPDYGCNTEAYTAGTFMELESLAPLHHLEPGEQAEHMEWWHLHSDIPLPHDADEEAIAAVLDPLVEEF